MNNIKKINTMKKVKCYKLSNGQIVESEYEAIRLQREIDFEKAIWSIVNREVDYYDFREVVGSVLIENADELRKIFNAKVMTRY